MTTKSEPILSLSEGVNDPSPVSRVIALGYYDGPTEGILQFGDAGPVFRFELLEQSESAESDELDVRVYGLYPLAQDSLMRLVAALAPYKQPTWPIWCPTWTFPSDEVRHSMDQEIATIVDQAGQLAWILIGQIGRSPVRLVPVKLAQAS
ncbi:MAG TPA: hypothetical protein VKS79_19465 [Gemmataceae bacterium]|nr:hypothetical protein [Gemmataceae bacterium]